jgi:hypothetical protein
MSPDAWCCQASYQVGGVLAKDGKGPGLVRSAAGEKYQASVPSAGGRVAPRTYPWAHRDKQAGPGPYSGWRAS